jgi:hypothetical protein
MALVTAQGFDLNPRIGQGLTRGIQTLGQFQTMGQRNLQAQREAQVREQIGAALQPVIPQQTQQQQMLAEQTTDIGGALAEAEQPAPVISQEERVALAKSIDPAIANKLLKDAGIDTQSKLAEASRFAAELENTPFDMRRQKIIARVENLRAEGRDPKDTLELLDLDEAAQNQTLLGVQLADLTTKERLAVRERQRATGPKIGTFNPRDYTTESFAEFRRTGDPSVLVRFKETEAVKREEDIKAKLKLEKLSEEKRQKIELQKIKIDETKFKDAEGRSRAIAAKEIRRNEADNAINVINNLLTGDRFSAGFGRIATITPETLLPQETVDIKAEIAQIVNLIGLESREKLKGQGTVSDSEASALAKSATTLANPLLSDDAARKELTRVRGIFETASARNQLKKETKEADQSVIRFNRQGQRIQ